MANNVNITAGSGVVVHADEYTHTTLGSGKTQLVKLVDGTLDSDTAIAVDVGAKANALRVAPANDITDATYIGDIKFGESLPAGTNAIGKLAANSGVDIGDVTLTAGTAAIGKLAANSGVDIGDVDVTSVIPGVAATNLGKAEDAGHSSGDVGVMALTVRQDTAAALGGTDADYQPLITDANGRLHVLDQNSAAILTALQIIDDWDDSDKCKVIIQTGSNAIGKLAANTGVDIGDVDVTSVIAGVGATNLGKARDSALGATDTGVMALAVRDDTLTTLTPADGDYVPLRVGSTGKLHVTDANITACNTGAVVISSGTVTTVSTVTNLAQMGGTALSMDEGTVDTGCQRVTLATDDDGVAHLATIAGDTTSIDGNITACNTGAVVLASGTVDTVTNLVQLNGTAITMDEGVHDAGCQRVTIATDDDAVVHLATIAGDTTAIQTSVEIMDDWDAVHDSAASSDGPQLMAAYDATKPAAVADGDAVRVLADEYGRLLAGVEKTAWHDTLDSGDASAAGVAVKASAASTILVVQSYVISVDAEMWVHLVDEDDTVLTGKFWLKAGGGVAITLPDKAPIIMGVDKDLEVRTEGAGNVSVSVTGYTIPG